MTFAEQLKEARKAAGLTQQQLADLTGIPKRTIESWEMEGKKGRAPAEWCQRLVLAEVYRMADAQDPQTIEALAKIAEENIPELEGRGDLESRNNDSEDFFETSVWSLKAALIAAYELGRKGAK